MNIETDIAPSADSNEKNIGSNVQKINNNTAYKISNKLGIIGQKLFLEYP